MSALQVTWLTNHFEQGKITQEEFTSLFQRITLSEQDSVIASETQSGNWGRSPKVARLHPETRLTLARVRSFKKLVGVMNYAIILFLICLAYLSAEHYQITGSLPSISMAGLEKLLTQTPREPLPSDIKLAAEYLSRQSDWDASHIEQFADSWQNSLSSERDKYVGEHWFQELKLVLSLHIAEQRILAKNGDRKAVQQAILLAQLAEQLGKHSG